MQLKFTQFSANSIIPVYKAVYPYPDKLCGHPSFNFPSASPPPVLVLHVGHLDDIARFECQLGLVHGDVIPEGLGKGWHGVWAVGLVIVPEKNYENVKFIKCSFIKLQKN